METVNKLKYGPQMTTGCIDKTRCLCDTSNSDKDADAICVGVAHYGCPVQ